MILGPISGNIPGNKEGTLVNTVRSLAKSAKSWADLSNMLFEPERGIIALCYPTKEERLTFRKTPEYLEIRRLVNEVMDRTGLIAGATPSTDLDRLIILE
jgi:hypothetical protein